MSRTGRRVAIITGGCQGIGASLVAACRRQGWSVVATYHGRSDGNLGFRFA